MKNQKRKSISVNFRKLFHFSINVDGTGCAEYLIYIIEKGKLAKKKKSR